MGGLKKTALRKEDNNSTGLKLETLNANKDVFTTKRCQIAAIEDNNKTVKTIIPEILDEENNLESVLSVLKFTGRFHVKLLALISFLVISSSAHSMNYVFSAPGISYSCRHQNCKIAELSKVALNSTLNFKCYQYNKFDDNGTCTLDNFDTTNVTDCKKWIYDKPNSFVAEFDLGCEDWKRTLVGTMHSIGVMIGLPILGLLSDKFGRKKILIFNLIAGGLIGVLKSFATSYFVFITLEMMEPMFGECYSTSFILAIEMVTNQNRPLLIVFISLWNTMGQIIMVLLAYLISNWRYYLIALYAPNLLLITFYIFWMDESLKWLLAKGKKSAAQQIIRQAAKMNDVTIDESKLIHLKCEHSSNASLSATLKITLSSRKLFIRMLTCMCIWFTSLFNIYALTINAVSLEGNKYVNFCLVSSSGTIGGIILLFVLKKFKRKGPLIFALTLTGLFCVSQPFVPKEHRWLSILLYLCGKINASVSLRVTYLYTTELFPTYTRNTILAMCSSFGRTAVMLAPQTPLLLKYWSGLPSLLVGILSLMTASVITLMPDTSDDVLPDTAKQAEAIGSGQNEKKGVKP